MNKKAYYNWDDIGMFLLVCILVGGCIFAGAYLFFSVEVDVRLEEAKTLSNKLVGAVVYNGYLKENVLSGDFDILKEAGISKEVINNEDYFFSLGIYRNGEIVESFVGGARDFEVECSLPGKNLPEFL